MPKDLFLKKLDLDLVYPPFLERLLVVKAACAEQGNRYLTTCLFRTWGESHQLYLKALQGGPRAAPAGLSAHNYGLASDECLVIQETPKRVVRWNKEDFEVLGKACKMVGLIHGLKNDLPHVNWPGFASGTELSPILKIWKENVSLPVKERLRKCWDYVDQNTPPLPAVGTS